MRFDVEELFETASMTLHQNLDIRTTTLGVNLKDCIDSDFAAFQDKVYRRVNGYARALIEHARPLEVKYGIPIVNKRISITPVSLIMETHATPEKYLAMAQTLDRAARDAGIDFIGGFGGLVQKGLTRSDAVLIESLPAVLAGTERVCAFLNVGSTHAGLNLDAVNLLGPMLLATAARTPDAIGCAKFVVFVNAPEDNPFMAGAYHGVGEPDVTLNVGISGPGVVRSVVEKNRDCDLTQLSEVIKRTVFKITRAGELIGRELARGSGRSVRHRGHLAGVHHRGGRFRRQRRGGVRHRADRRARLDPGDRPADGRGEEGRRDGQRQRRRPQRHLHPGERGRGDDRRGAEGRVEPGQAGGADRGLLGGAGHVRHPRRHARGDDRRDHRR